MSKVKVSMEGHYEVQETPRGKDHIWGSAHSLSLCLQFVAMGLFNPPIFHADRRVRVPLQLSRPWWRCCPVSYVQPTPGHGSQRQ